MGNPTEIRNLLWEWLTKRLSTTSFSLLQEQRQKIDLTDPQSTEHGNQSARLFFVGFSRIAGWVGKQDLLLTEAELEAAAVQQPGWQPQGWTVDQVARIWWVLGLPWQEQPERSQHLLAQLFNHGDVAELVALYQGLCLYPEPEAFCHQATQGIRSNMTAVFNAVALHNPYPAAYLDETAWNQLVLKALFVESPLGEIYGFDHRLNPKLAQMLTDYAHERWAAGRTVHPELWRGLGVYATSKHQKDLERVLSSNNPLEREAGALACAVAPSTSLQQLLTSVPRLEQKIQTQKLNWDDLYRRLHPLRCC